MAESIPPPVIEPVGKIIALIQTDFNNLIGISRVFMI